MCQTPGWHRRDTANDATSATFWFCYVLDKGLSLRFGRTSVMHDWDISLPRRFGNMNLPPSWGNVLNMWIESETVLGEICELLYSQTALARSSEQRIETARILVDKMKLIWRQASPSAQSLKQGTKTRDTASPSAWIGSTSGRSMFDMVLISGEVSHWSSLTLVYRAIPTAPCFPTTFNSECIEAARMAFDCHKEYMNFNSHSRSDMAGYLNW